MRAGAVLLRAYTSPLDQAGPQRDMLHEGHVHGIVNSCASFGDEGPQGGLDVSENTQGGVCGTVWVEGPRPADLSSCPSCAHGEGVKRPLGALMKTVCSSHWGTQPRTW